MLDERIQELIKEQEKFQGIDVTKLEPGTLIEVNTIKSIYLLQITDESNQIIAHGGKHLPTPKEVRFNGSTFGGSMLKLNYIGYGMHMEMGITDRKKITTSPVIKAKIIGEGWEYEMEWN